MGFPEEGRLVLKERRTLTGQEGRARVPAKESSLLCGGPVVPVRAWRVLGLERRPEARPQSSRLGQMAGGAVGSGKSAGLDWHCPSAPAALLSPLLPWFLGPLVALLSNGELQ